MINFEIPIPSEDIADRHPYNAGGTADVTVYSDGEVVVLGHFTDPDGGWHELGDITGWYTDDELVEIVSKYLRFKQKLEA